MKNLWELENEKLKIKVKTVGAELCSLKTTANETEYIWQADPKVWNRHSPLLFPVIGRLGGGLCRIDGKEYKTPMHGFAKDSLFEQVTEEPGILAFQLQDNEQTRAVYPYKFRLTVEYALKENGLIVGYKVKNKNDGDMFFSIGGHPAFACPIEKDLTFSDYYLRFNEYETADRWYIENGGIGRNERFLDNENTIQLTDSLFDRDALIFKGLKSNSITLKSDKGAKAVTVDFPGFTHLGIWSRSKDAPYVCIEPWYGIDDPVGFNGDIKEKEGILALKPGETFATHYTITPRRGEP
jgi:galactose mutarotase-like enzyme